MYTRYNPSSIKLDVKDMAGMLFLEFPHVFGGHRRLVGRETEVPDFDGLVVTGADQTALRSIERQCPDKPIVARQGLQAFARGH